jgi:hypothetical protein
MNKHIENISKARTWLLEQIKDLSTDQLNQVPPGFNNNIIWNLGHMVVAQQGLCYARAGLKPVLEENFMGAYKPGTKPSGLVSETAINEIRLLLQSTLHQLDLDVQENIFSGYTAFTTRYGAAINNIDDAIQFVMYHEGLHSGIVLSLLKIIKAGS